ncbi:MAG TPA: hypothetical protein VNM38_04730 [Solirubrobacterales bacterium]|nr:hypothetical protein [Solirubrobacterales bacterium]
MPGLRRLYAPQRVAVRTDPRGAPTTVEGVAVEAVREEWLVEDRWWTGQPLRRHYFEVAIADGRALTVFRTARAQRWYRQRA